MESHFYNNYDTENPNDFQEKSLKDLSEEMLIVKIATQNSPSKLLIAKSIYKTFELPPNLIPDSILPLFYNRIYKEDRMKVLRMFTQLQKTEKKATLKFRSLLPKKGLSHFEAYIKTKLDANNSTIFYITFLKMTAIENKQLGNNLTIDSTSEKELKLIQTIKLYSEHNNRLLNFSHITSHNLNTHSGNIKMLLEMINTEENAQKRKEYLDHLQVVSYDLNKTITDLSQIVNIQNNLNVIKEPLDLNSYLEKNNALVNNNGFENKITIINKVPKDSIINFNSAYLASVLLNFSTNAVKYAHPDRFPIIVFEFFTENKKKVLTITDNGLGIDLEKYGNSLFGMYKTFHKHKNANGIGLYITKNQIESMNGQITVESKVGVGTTFKIIFFD